MKRNKTNNKPPKQNDAFLKGAVEENLPDFLRFMYADADGLFDFDRGIELMDKELLAIIPDREQKKGKRVADLLVKVFLKDGTKKHILINLELEGADDAALAERIYRYNIRIWDRYNVPVASIVFFTGNCKQHRPVDYKREVLDTSIDFRYRGYHIFDHTEEQLLAMDNIFAFVVLACQKSLLEGRLPEVELGKDRSTIARALIKTDRYDKDRIIGFLVFLKNFIFIDNEKINRKFDELIYEVSGGTIDMGVIEVLKKQERQQGLLEGLQQGSIQKSFDFVKNLIIDFGFSDEQAAKAAEVSVEFVKKVRLALKNK